MIYNTTSKLEYKNTLAFILKSFSGITNTLTGERGMFELLELDADVSGVIHIPSFDNSMHCATSIDGYPTTSYTMYFMKVDSIVATLTINIEHSW